MTFWILAASLTGLTCLALLAALRSPAGDAADADRAFYDLQIAEIDRQVGLKLIGEAEAVSARTEAARRLLDIAPAPSEATPSHGARKLASMLVLALVPLVALPVYWRTGSPAVPSFALATRPPPVIADGGLSAMLARIEAHLKETPGDGRGHEIVAPIYMRLERHADAAHAYAEAIRLLGSTASRQAGLGEALVYVGKGVMGEEARAAFRAALEQDANEARSLFFLALGADQAGQPAEAVSWLERLDAGLPEGPFRNEVQARLAQLRGGVSALAGVPESQQQAIRTMVEGLASRLASNGGTAEEWARLVKALYVLQERDRAQAILSEARQTFAGDPAALKLVEEAAK